jgi:type II secretory ATPase GspE/PulE/Tfp pilus assembly ATPase PilB-like protein
MTPHMGSSWTNEVLNTGKVDEIKFAAELARLFREPCENCEPRRSIARRCSSCRAASFSSTTCYRSARSENTIRLATFDVFNSISRKLAAQALPGKKIEWVVVPRGQLLRCIKSVYGVGAETFEEILANAKTYEDALDREQAQDITTDDPEASVVKFVNQVIREAIVERATDIHVEPLEADLRIRYRIDGILHEVAVPPQLRVLQSAIISRLKVMSHMDIAERRLPQDGRINLTTSAGAIDVRVSTIPTVNGESISLRLLSRSDSLAFGLDRLDMSSDQVEIVKRLLQQPNGIILVTGPTGSGKSTSLYSFLTTINQPTRRIITVEEPVEYRLPGVSQIDVKPEIGLTFANGLRAILRQDPNIVMVGEIRDFETAEIAIRAAMTGHLVFSTLHTNDAVSGITRLLDMGIEPFLWPASSAASSPSVSSDHLPGLQRRDGYDMDYLQEIGAPFRRTCSSIGAKAAITAVRPVIAGGQPFTSSASSPKRCRRLVIRKGTGSELKARAMQDGMVTLRTDGWRRVLKGQTTIEEVVRVTQQDEAISETDAREIPQ